MRLILWFEIVLLSNQGLMCCLFACLLSRSAAPCLAELWGESLSHIYIFRKSCYA